MCSARAGYRIRDISPVSRKTSHIIFQFYSFVFVFVVVGVKRVVSKGGAQCRCRFEMPMSNQVLVSCLNV
jgi:hypothetical protein